ncbi:INSIG domain-containing protein [Histoplasma capsulatum G186AR]|uniref:INSIG domain-containing protein n=1 Tax=Ajellomyces capsulatus (strain G186AR / H82 / ATCC MYA-2454 / RMSCC 2432) TaxID=447093 RepID=C0NAF6_AJECG|nr:INSIG domain-containing protein [Histoplasma capsulatum G186AR]EEH10647.1 INSIG domain-containing protein [Histoplasma capsulatum G186AR]
MDHEPPILRPRARKPFELASSSTETSESPTPILESSSSTTATMANNTNQDSLDPSAASSSKDSLAASRTRSILNLTSSTLLGIYSPSTLDSPRYELSAWDAAVASGTQTPTTSYSPYPQRFSQATTTTTARARTPTASITKTINPSSTSSRRTRFMRTPRRRRTLRTFYLPLLLRSALLFVFGVVYGTIITHLHDNPRVTPIKIENIDVIKRGSWVYMVFWGVAGVALGGLLPWFDVVWEEFVEGESEGEGVVVGGEETEGSSGNVEVSNRDLNGSGDGSGVVRANGNGKVPVQVDREQLKDSGSIAADWNQVVRSIGAFVGIAFAIRKLPWQSTLQVSLTLALVNPFLWYLIDRSKPGFMLSTAVGLLGMVTLLGINPDVVPGPTVNAAESAVAGNGSGILSFASQESIAVGTWIASVLFCSCVCFGNIGRRLAVGWES